LGIPFGPDTSNEKLRELIEKRKKGESVMSVAKPECFAIYWEAVGDTPCQACVMKTACLQSFATGRLDAVQKEMPDASLEDLSRRLELSPDAVLVALDYKAKAKPKLEVLQGGKTDEEEPEVPSEEVQEELMEAVEEAAAAQEAEEVLPDMEDLAKAEEFEPEEAPAPQPEGEHTVTKKKATKKPPTKKKAAKKPPVKKATAKKVATKKKATKKVAKKASKKRPPQRAASVKRARAAATKGVTKHWHVQKVAIAEYEKQLAMLAKSARAPVGERDREWSPEAHLNRFYAEKKRSPLLAHIPIGAKLSREYGKKMLEVEVTEVGYLHKGKMWPTLYSLTKHLTGTSEAPAQRKEAGKEETRPEGTRQLCNWSAPKFWRVKTLLEAEGILPT